MANLPDLTRLKSTLLTSELQHKNPALFQVINQLIDYIRQNQLSVASDIAGTGDVNGPNGATNNAIARFDGALGKTIKGSGITIADGEVGTLGGTNSSDITLAGTPDYITIVAQVITRHLIDLLTDIENKLPIANMLGYYSPLTDGDTFETDLIYANGEVLTAFVYI